MWCNKIQKWFRSMHTYATTLLEDLSLFFQLSCAGGYRKEVKGSKIIHFRSCELYYMVSFVIAGIQSSNDHVPYDPEACKHLLHRDNPSAPDPVCGEAVKWWRLKRKSDLLRNHHKQNWDPFPSIVTDFMHFPGSEISLEARSAARSISCCSTAEKSNLPDFPDKSLDNVSLRQSIFPVKFL